MATALTFSSLIASLQAYLERGSTPTDPTVFAQLPSLINLAERAVARRLKITGMIIPVTSTLQVGVSVYAKPSGWRRTTSMNFGVSTVADPSPAQNSRVPLFSRSYEYCRGYWPDQTLMGPPKFYSDYNYQNWLVVPTPDINYPWEINYYGLPNLLDNTNQTNFWTDFAPETLLYRSLLECTPFLKNDDRITVWEKLYEEAAGGLSTEDISRAVDRASVRKET